MSGFQRVACRGIFSLTTEDIYNVTQTFTDWRQRTVNVSFGIHYFAGLNGAEIHSV